jgi:uncharacterized membrane protein
MTKKPVDTEESLNQLATKHLKAYTEGSSAVAIRAFVRDIFKDTELVRAAVTLWAGGRLNQLQRQETYQVMPTAQREEYIATQNAQKAGQRIRSISALPRDWLDREFKFIGKRLRDFTAADIDYAIEYYDIRTATAQNWGKFFRAIRDQGIGDKTVGEVLSGPKAKGFSQKHRMPDDPLEE